MRGNITYGNGIYKSVDAGKTWKNVGLKDSRQIGAFIVDPQNPDIVLVAAFGHAFGPNQERGVFRTTDGGKTWQKVLYKDENTGGDRCRDRSAQSECRFRGALAGASPAVEFFERRTRQRSLPLGRQWRDLEATYGKWITGRNSRTHRH